MQKTELKIQSWAPSGIQIRKLPDGTESRIIEGHAIVFDRESLPLWREGDTDFVEVIDREAVSLELLNRSDIMLTMNHDMGRLLARSKNGRGSLTYKIDDMGVRFAAEMPNTQWGDEALELVRRGIVDGCSFMFSTVYNDRQHVARESGEGKTVMRVKKITGIYDFTLTPSPAYPQTDCAARSAAVASIPTEEVQEPDNSWRDQVADMRKNAKY